MDGRTTDDGRRREKREIDYFVGILPIHILTKSRV